MIFKGITLKRVVPFLSCYAILLLVWVYFHPSFMSFLCRAQTTMSCYVMNFESLLLKEFPSNGMTKPLKTIISVAIFLSIFLYKEKRVATYCNPFGSSYLFSTAASISFIPSTTD